jgi:hypothetical protein
MTHLRLALIRFALMKINSRNLLFVTLVAIIAALSGLHQIAASPQRTANVRLSGCRGASDLCRLADRGETPS